MGYRQHFRFLKLGNVCIFGSSYVKTSYFAIKACSTETLDCKTFCFRFCESWCVLVKCCELNLLTVRSTHVRISYIPKSTIQQIGKMCCIIEILFSLFYKRIVLMVVCWCYWKQFNRNGFVSMLMNITFYAKILNERDKSVNERRLDKMNAFSRYYVWVGRYWLYIFW